MKRKYNRIDLDKTRQGLARQCKVWLGDARYGKTVKRYKTWRGQARSGMVWLGMVMSDAVIQTGRTKRGRVRRGLVRQGKARVLTGKTLSVGITKLI